MAKKKQDEDDIKWHRAFFEALQAELEAYKGALIFEAEYELKREFPRIDVVVIKKPRTLVITKNIGRIFRMVNVVEYKGPYDCLSVRAFYKGLAYVCLYLEQAPKNVEITDMTLTFVVNRHPYNLLKHLASVQKYQIERELLGPGIYEIKGSIVPIQIIESKKLPLVENLWLSNLHGGLSIARLADVMAKGQKKPLGMYFRAVLQANIKQLKEVRGMTDAMFYAEMESILEESGWLAKAVERERQKTEAERQKAEANQRKAEAERQKAEANQQKAERKFEANQRKTVRKLIKKSWSVTDIAEFMELDLAIVQKYLAEDT
jgi:hypothetical protein